MPLEPKPLPDGVHFTDVLEAAQAAWLARDYELARDLIRSYIDPNGEFCCMRCAAMCEDEPWKINGHLGTFYVCPNCATIVTQQQELLGNGGEIFMQGPVERVVQRTRRENCTVVEVKTSQQHITIAKR